MQYLETLLGTQGLKIAWWLAAFIIVIVLAVVVLRLLRSLMGGRLNMSERGSARGRAPRLGVTEYFNLDKQGRRLVIVRRDNIEHLVLIGGPNDVLIEANILRGERAGVPRVEMRETNGYGRAEGDYLPEPIAPARPLPEPPMVSPQAALEARIDPPFVPEPRLSAAPAIDDRTPVADIPRDHLTQRLEEVLRKPLPPRAAEPESRPQETRKPEPRPFQPPEPPRPAPASPTARFDQIMHDLDMQGLETPSSLPHPVEVNVPEIRGYEPKGAAPKPAEPRPAELRSPESPHGEAKPAEQAFDMPEAELHIPAAEARPTPPPADNPPAERKPEAKLAGMLANVFKPRTPPPEPQAAAPKQEPVPPPAPAAPSPAKPPVTLPAAMPQPPVAPVPPPPAATTPALPPAAKNPFDSLEEEMAKLLGRGLGDKT